MKRLISANTSEMLAMNAAELKQSIKASEGRVILSENVATRETYIGDITNAEIARAFGADLDPAQLCGCSGAGHLRFGARQG